jgi:hypothetical protein
MRDPIIPAQLEAQIRDLKQMTNVAWTYGSELLGPAERRLTPEEADTLLFVLGNLQDRADQVVKAWEREFEERHGKRQVKS